MDGSDFNFEATMAVGFWRIAITQDDGVATFSQITVSDVRRYQCLRFYFVTGDLGPIIPEYDLNFCDNNQNARPGMCAKSQSTEVYCFKNDMLVSILNKG